MSSYYDAHPSLGRDIFGAAELGDRRRTARLVKTFDRMCAHPGGTLPDKLASPPDLRGLYRLCDCEGVTHEAVLEPARAYTRGADRGLSPGRAGPARRHRVGLHHAELAGRRPGADRQGGPARLPLPQRPGRGGRLGGGAGADGSAPAPPRRGARRRDAHRAPRPPDAREPAVGPRHATPAGRRAPDRRRRPGRRYVRVPRARIPQRPTVRDPRRQGAQGLRGP